MIFPIIKRASREFQQLAACSMPELTYKPDIPIFVDGEDGHSPDMFNNIETRNAAMRHPHLIITHRKCFALIFFFALQRFKHDLSLFPEKG